MIRERSPLAGKTVSIRPEMHELGGQRIDIEDWWQNVAGKSWQICSGNPACINYAVRTGLSDVSIPTDNEVLYGKIDGLGHLVHISEIDPAEAA